MKSRFVSQLKIGDSLEDEPFLLREVHVGSSKQGDPFLRLSLADKTGQINSVYWNVPDQVASWVKPGQVALVDGKVGRYRDSPQIVVNSLVLHESPNMEDFLATASRDFDEMLAELRTLVGSLNQPYQSLASALLLDADFLPRFAASPAAKRMHHAYAGGLLFHVLSMARIGDWMVGHYPRLDRDLLLTGVLLHDIGKVIEYDTTAGIQITDDGHLVGHLVRGVIMVEAAAAELPDFPPPVLRQIVHLLVSHHGKVEWGSPVSPKTLEAVLLHQLDLLDSRVQGFLDFMGEDNAEGKWSQNISPMFGTYLRRSIDGEG